MGVRSGPVAEPGTAARRDQDTARVAVFPSAALRPIPGFMFTVPQGWVLDESTEALAVVRTADQVDGFWVNALLTHDRVPRSVELKRVANITIERLRKQCPDLSIRAEKLGRFGARETYLRAVELTAPEGERRLAQVQAMFFAPPQGESRVLDLFQVTGTCPLQAFEAHGPRFVEIVASFRFT
jgi:hypothetical protein